MQTMSVHVMDRQAEKGHAKYQMFPTTCKTCASSGSTPELGNWTVSPRNCIKKVAHLASHKVWAGEITIPEESAFTWSVSLLRTGGECAHVQSSLVQSHFFDENDILSMDLSKCDQ